MTNQLFRDYLDGKIHVQKPSGPIYHFPEWSTEPADLSRPNFWVGPVGAEMPSTGEPQDLIAAGFKPVGYISEDGWELTSSERVPGANGPAYAYEEWTRPTRTISEVSMTIPIQLSPSARLIWKTAMAAIIKRESQVNEMHALFGRNFDPSAEYDMPDSERHAFNWQVSQISKFTGQSPEEIADILHRFGDSAHFHMAPAPDLGLGAKDVTAPRHGPPQSASWRGRGRVTKYARG